MRKILLLVLASVLILASLSPACAEKAEEAELFGLWESGGEQERWIASAVPAAEGVVVVPAALLPEKTDQLVVSDGVRRWEAKAVLQDEAGMLAMVFYDPADQPAHFSAWQLLPRGERVPVTGCRIHRLDAEGARSDCGVLASEEILVRGKRCMLLTLTDQAAPGSALLTGDGQLAGIVTAVWAEGVNRVVAVSAEEVAGSLLEAAARLNNLPAWGEAPEGLEVTMEKNLVTIDWSRMVLPEKAEGETVYMILLDTGNNYLNYYPAETEDRCLKLLLTPARFYLVGAAACADAPNDIPQSFAYFSLPPAERLTEYHFRPVLTAVAEAPEEGLKTGEHPVPVTEVTEELLRSGRAYFYSHSTYLVQKDISDRTLLVCLTDPNGVNYSYESSWIYAPAYMKKDIWFMSMEETGLTSSLDQNGYPAGVYQLAFYVDGDLADMVEFELK